MEGMVKCSANFVPLSPISFLERAASVYGDKVSIVYGNTKYLWRETRERCLKFASALCQMGVCRGDVVAALAPNIPALYELYFGVPMAGAVLSALNTRLDSPTLALLLQQLEAKVICVDFQFVQIALKALEVLSVAKVKSPVLVVIRDSDPRVFLTAQDLPPGSLDYNGLLATGRDYFQIISPIDECDPITVNYTSGSTGMPKGAVYSHRAAYLNSVAEIFRFDIRSTPVFLWTVDMFRCSGWCFTWAVAALGGTNICLRNATAKAIFEAIFLHKVTHLCGAPTILNTIAEALATDHRPLPCKVDIIVAGALPPLQILNKVHELGFNISHSYGMTEALGPVTVKSLEPDQVDTKCREGIHSLLMEGVDVKDPTTMRSVPPDGKTVGEVMFRSNTLMSGYLKNAQATRQAFKSGWYRTGDLGVRHPIGSIQMKDRVVDTIVSSGGETISSLEVEAVLASHPVVQAAAVVGRPDDTGYSGERPCAFVELKEGCSSATSDEIVEFCRERLPDYMVPRSVVLGDLPMNSTGKVQKFVLRERAKTVGSLSHSNGH